jgi:hypothetical protein
MATHSELNRLLLGKVLEDAKSEYVNNVEFRIIEEDGIPKEIGIDTKSTRVNVIVRRGIITEVLGMY